MTRQATKNPRYTKSISVRRTLTADVSHDQHGRVSVYHRLEGNRQMPDGWGVHYEEWPETREEQLALLDRCPLAREQPRLVEFLIASITRLCVKLRRERTRYGVPLSEMPAGVRPALKRRAADAGGKGASAGFLVHEIPRVGPVFGDDRLVLSGRPPRGSQVTPDPRLAEDWREVSRRRGIELEPVAYSGSRTAGVVWFAQRAQLKYGRNSNTEKMAVDASVYLHLTRRFRDLHFGLVLVGSTPLISLHDGRDRVGFVAPHSTNGGLFHLNFMPRGAELIRNRYEAEIIARERGDEDGDEDGERRDAA